jgi:hypothetical protein
MTRETPAPRCVQDDVTGTEVSTLDREVPVGHRRPPQHDRPHVVESLATAGELAIVLPDGAAELRAQFVFAVYP